MQDHTNQSNPFSISEEAQEKAKSIIENAFRGLTEHMRQITEDLSEFNENRQEMRRRMQNGTRRTSGRIV